MKQILLATALIALPVAAFTAFQMSFAPPATAAAEVAVKDPLGDLSALKTIIADVQGIAATADFTAAEKRITDFETAWDDAAPSMRKMDANAWGNVDQAADAALDALRTGTPAAADVSATLTALSASLDNPAGVAGPAPTGDVAMVSGIAVTDAVGRPLPCEDMLSAVAKGLADTKADKTAAIAFQTKALERCNADDDARADGFSAQALALLSTL